MGSPPAATTAKMPPKKSTRNVTPASAAENAPVTAAASVEPSVAAQANAAAGGIEGRLFHSSRLLDSHASLKSSGAMNRTKKSSESMWTSATCGTTSAAARPTAIWTSGS